MEPIACPPEDDDLLRCPWCGAAQDDSQDPHDPMTGWHESGCDQVTKRLLAQEIRVICAEIDRLRSNPTGTAEKAMYWAYWPPGPLTDIKVFLACREECQDWLIDARTLEADLPDPVIA